MSRVTPETLRSLQKEVLDNVHMFPPDDQKLWMKVAMTFREAAAEIEHLQSRIKQQAEMMRRIEENS